MLHDYLLYSIGLNQNYMYGLYSLLFILYFIKLGTYLIHTKYKIFLVLAFLFLGSSVGLDLVFESEGIQYFFEDSLKILGITSWFLFYTYNAFYLVLQFFVNEPKSI